MRLIGLEMTNRSQIFISFQEIQFVTFQEIQNLVTSSENVVDWVVQDQVQVSLSVTSVLGQDLLLAVTLGQHVHAVGETDDLGWSDRELASLGAAWAALDSNDVTTAERGVQNGAVPSMKLRSDRICAYVLPPPRGTWEGLGGGVGVGGGGWWGWVDDRWGWWVGGGW